MHLSGLQIIIYGLMTKCPMNTYMCSCYNCFSSNMYDVACHG